MKNDLQELELGFFKAMGDNHTYRTVRCSWLELGDPHKWDRSGIRYSCTNAF